VLGQYDLALLGREPVSTGRLYFVEPNIALFQQRHGLPGAEFRFWVALHETTHAFQFEGQPWVRDYLNGLLARYLETLASDFLAVQHRQSLARWAQRLRENMAQGRHFLELMLSPEQRALFRSLQALMALMEGYSNHVMQQMGARSLAHYEQIRRQFEHRLRERSPAERLFSRLTGLDLKIEQYLLGERFVNEVVAQRGIAFMNRVWEGAGHLPTLEELRQPAGWIARLEGGATLGASGR